MVLVTSLASQSLANISLIDLSFKQHHQLFSPLGVPYNVQPAQINKAFVALARFNALADHPCSNFDLSTGVLPT